MAKMNIYVPDDLAEEMRQRGNENWSQVFQTAVRQRLGVAPIDQEMRTHMAISASAKISSAAAALRTELQLDAAKAYAVGYREGVDAASQLSAEQFRDFDAAAWDAMTVLNIACREERAIWVGICEELATAFGLRPGTEPSPVSETQIAEGFRDALKEIWHEATSGPVVAGEN